MKNSRESRLARLERTAAEVERQSVPVAVIADEDGNVEKFFSSDRLFVDAPRGLTTEDFPETTKVYLFDADFPGEA